jgi:hypothetical protein
MATAQFLLDMHTAVTKFQKDLDTMVGSTRSFAHRMEATFLAGQRQVAAFLSGISGLQVGLGALSMASLSAVVRQAILAGDAIHDMAQRIGISTDSLQELGYVAKLSGLGMDELEQGLTFLNRRLAEARGGSKEAAEAFRRIGVDPTQFRDAGEALGAVADGINALGDDALKTQARVDLFSRSGNRLAVFLGEGSAGLERMREEARRLGIVMDRELLKQSADAADALDRLASVVGSNLTAGLLRASPLIITLAEELSKTVAVAGKFWTALLVPDSVLLSQEDLAERLGDLDEQLRKLRQVEQSGAAFRAGQQAATVAEIEQLEKRRTALRAFLRERAQLDRLAEKPVGPVAAAVSPEQLRATETATATLKKLQEQLANLDATPLQRLIGEARRGTEGAPAALLAEIAATVTALYHRNQAVIEAAAQTKALVDADSEAAASALRLAEADRSLADTIREQILTPQEKYRTTLRDLDRLLASGRLAQEDYARAVEAAGQALADQTTGPVDEYIADLQRQLNLLQLSVREQEQWAEALRFSGVATSDQATRIRDLVRQTQDVRAGRELQDRVQAIREETEQMALLASGQEELARLVAIENEYRRQGVELTDAQRASLEGAIAAQQAQAQELERIAAVEGFIEQQLSGIGDVLAEMATTGKASLEDFVSSAIKDLIRLAWQLLVVEQLMKAVRGALSGAGGFSASSSGTSVGQAGGIGTADVIRPTGAARGAVVKARAGGSLMLVGEAGQDEAIVPLDRAMSSWSGGDRSPSVEINIINKSAEPVTQSRRTSGSGREAIDFVIGASRSDAQSGGLDKVMRERYGIVPTRASR